MGSVPLTSRSNSFAVKIRKRTAPFCASVCFLPRPLEVGPPRERRWSAFAAPVPGSTRRRRVFATSTALGSGWPAPPRGRSRSGRCLSLRPSRFRRDALPVRSTSCAWRARPSGRNPAICWATASSRGSWQDWAGPTSGRRPGGRSVIPTAIAAWTSSCRSCPAIHASRPASWCSREINLGNLVPGESRQVSLRLENGGMGLLHGSAAIEDAPWLVLGDGAGSPRKVFQFRHEINLAVQVVGKRLLRRHSSHRRRHRRRVQRRYGDSGHPRRGARAALSDGDPGRAQLHVKSPNEPGPIRKRQRLFLKTAASRAGTRSTAGTILSRGRPRTGRAVQQFFEASAWPGRRASRSAITASR